MSNILDETMKVCKVYGDFEYHPKCRCLPCSSRNKTTDDSMAYAQAVMPIESSLKLKDKENESI